MVNDNIVLENARLIFRNFSGKPSKYNSAGNRNFCVILDPETAQQMADDGWNVKWPKTDDDNLKPFIQISVSFEHIKPKIWLITSTGRTQVTEETVDSLDWAEMANVDLIINPYNWKVNGKVGVKAYVKSMFITIAEDELEKKYRVSDEDDMNY